MGNFSNVGNDLNRTIYKSRFKLLRVTYHFDLNQFLNDFDFSLTLTIVNHS